jgi:hypothetical protein
MVVKMLVSSCPPLLRANVSTAAIPVAPGADLLVLVQASYDHLEVVGRFACAPDSVSARLDSPMTEGPRGSSL